MYLLYPCHYACLGCSCCSQQDLLAAIGHARHSNHISQLHRKTLGSYVSRLAGYVIGSDGVGFIRGMTMDERHAELTYAESLFEKVGYLFLIDHCPEVIV